MNKLTQKKTNQDIPLEFIPLKSSLPDTRNLQKQSKYWPEMHAAP
jgi:hypothetical protein